MNEAPSSNTTTTAVAATAASPPAAGVGSVSITLHSDYRGRVDFPLPGVPGLPIDASPPLGHGQGPDAEMLLMAAVGSCLSTSLAFALRKFKNEDVAVHSTVHATLGRNEQGRLRVQGLAVQLRLNLPAAGLKQLERALAQYEDFCVVTQSVRRGIPVATSVFDGAGVQLAG